MSYHKGKLRLITIISLLMVVCLSLGVFGITQIINRLNANAAIRDQITISDGSGTGTGTGAGTINADYDDTTQGQVYIYTKAGLETFRDKVNTGKTGNNNGDEGFCKTTVILMADIDLGGEEWTGIGVYVSSKEEGKPYPFKGIFYGNGYMIKNYKGGGLFHYTVGAIIEDLIISDVTITNDGSGLLIDIAVNGRIDNCFICNAKNDIKGDNAKLAGFVGQLACVQSLDGIAATALYWIGDNAEKNNLNIYNCGILGLNLNDICYFSAIYGSILERFQKSDYDYIDFVTGHYAKGNITVKNFILDTIGRATNFHPLCEKLSNDHYYPMTWFKARSYYWTYEYTNYDLKNDGKENCEEFEFYGVWKDKGYPAPGTVGDSAFTFIDYPCTNLEAWSSVYNCYKYLVPSLSLRTYEFYERNKNFSRGTEQLPCFINIDKTKELITIKKEGTEGIKLKKTVNGEQKNIVTLTYHKDSNDKFDKWEITYETRENNNKYEKYVVCLAKLTEKTFMLGVKGNYLKDGNDDEIVKITDIKYTSTIGFSDLSLIIDNDTDKTIIFKEPNNTTTLAKIKYLFSNNTGSSYPNEGSAGWYSVSVDEINCEYSEFLDGSTAETGILWIMPVYEMKTYSITLNAKCAECADQNHGGSFSYGSPIGVTVEEGSSETYTPTITSNTSSSLTIGNLLSGTTVKYDNNTKKISIKYDSNTLVEITPEPSTYHKFDKVDSVLESGITLNDSNTTKSANVSFAPITFTAMCAYSEEGEMVVDDNYNTIEVYYYNCQDSALSQDLVGTEITINGDIKFGFATWQVGPFDSEGYYLLNQGAGNYLKISSFTCTEQEANKIIEMAYQDTSSDDSEDSFYVKLNYSEKNTDIYGHIYYYVTEISSGSYGNVDMVNGIPVITAKWSKTYTVNMTNYGSGNTLWYKADENKSIKNNGNTNLGVLKDGTAAYEAQFYIRNGVTSYPFVASSGYAFLKKQDIASSEYKSTSGDNYYAVYNYGYEIESWCINFTYYTYISGVKTQQVKYLVYDKNNNTWQIKNNRTYNEIANLVGGGNLSNMAGYAEYLDGLFTADGSENIAEITMFPVWKPAIIKLTGSAYFDTDTILYGDLYNTNVSTAQVGKTVACLLTSEMNNNVKNVIALDGTWNYYQLTNDQYSYSDNAYSLDVECWFVDNIYRINLDGIKKNGLNYELETELSDGYTIKEENNYGNAVYCYEYEEECSSVWIEDYTAELNDDISNYINEITDGTHKMLRTVFGTGDDRYIYLANEQSYGNLPRFKVDYESDLIYYIDTNKQDWDETPYIYTTTVYIASLHGSLANDITSNGTWSVKYQEGSVTEYNNQITAKYFRKSYLLDLSVLLDNNLSDVGHLELSIVDVKETGAESKSGNYHVEYNQLANAMKYTSATEEFVGQLQVFAGCVVTISVHDQSQESGSPADKMIGYRYAGYQDNSIEIVEINSNADDTFAISKNAYVVTLDSPTIAQDALSGLGLAMQTNGLTLSLDFAFERINYSLSVAMSSGDDSQGNFNVNVISSKSPRRFSNLGNIQIDNLTIGDIISISYVAELGYQFDEEYPITLILANGNEICLLSMDAFNQTKAQTIVIELNANWLKTNYYQKMDALYTSKDVNQISSVNNKQIKGIGLVEIRTTPIVFAYKVKLYDSTLSNLWVGEIDTLLTYSFKQKDGDTYLLTEDNLGVTLAPIFSTRALSGKDYAVINYEGKDYAILNSHTYQPQNALYGLRLRKEYSFPCDIPDDDYLINSAILSYLVVYSSGEILPQSSRTIYMTAEVREMYLIDVSVKELPYDANDTTRSTEVYNNSNNLCKNAVLHLTENADYTTHTSFYTYNGLTNGLKSSYDKIRYSAVNYYVNGELLQNAEYVLDNLASPQADLVIQYVPKPLDLTINYYLNNVAVEQDNPSLTSVLGSFGVMATKPEMYINSTLTYVYTLLNEEDYTLSVEVNGLPNSTYTISNADYDIGKIVYDVYVNENPSNSISVSMAMCDSRGYVGDNFGSFTLSISGVIQCEDQVKITNVKVLTNKNVRISLNIPKGYEYAGYKFYKLGDQLISPEDHPLNGNMLDLIASFDVNKDNGSYVIYVRKQALTATFVDSSNQHNYTITSCDGVTSTSQGYNTVLNNLQLGDTITFVRKQPLLSERLINYFYMQEEQEIALPSDVTTLKITSDMLDSSNNIALGVTNVDRFKAQLTIQQGEQYLVVDASSEIVKGSVYVDQGTILKLSLSTIVDGKYDIALSGDLTLKADQVEEYLTITKDISIFVSVTPKPYTVTITQHRYTNIDQLLTNNPQVLSNTQDTAYGAVVTIELNQDVSSWSAVEIILSGNDQPTTTVRFVVENGNVTAQYLNEDGVLVNLTGTVNGYTCILFGEAGARNVKIVTLASNDISVQVTQIGYVQITG